MLALLCVHLAAAAVTVTLPAGSGLKTGGFSLMAYDVADQPDRTGVAIAPVGPTGAGVTGYAVGARTRCATGRSYSLADDPTACP